MKLVKFKRAVLILVIFVVLAGIHLYITTQNIGIKYRVTDLKIKQAKIRARNQYLGFQVAKKENLAQIEKVARSKLGMIYPDKVNYIPETASPTPEVSSGQAPRSDSGQASTEARP